MPNNYLLYTAHLSSCPDQPWHLAIRSDSVLTHDQSHLPIIREAMTRGESDDLNEIRIHAAGSLAVEVFPSHPPLLSRDGFTVWDVTHLCHK